METITITGKTWKAGQKTLVLTIPKPVITALQIRRGDILQATITKAANAEVKISKEKLIETIEREIEQPTQKQKVMLRR